MRLLAAIRDLVLVEPKRLKGCFVKKATKTKILKAVDAKSKAIKKVKKSLYGEYDNYQDWLEACDRAIFDNAQKGKVKPIYFTLLLYKPKDQFCTLVMQHATDSVKAIPDIITEAYNNISKMILKGDELWVQQNCLSGKNLDLMLGLLDGKKGASRKILQKV